MTLNEASFQEALSAAVRARGLGLDRLRQHLTEMGTPLSIATLSYWQSGRSRPTRGRSLEAIGNLEKILRLEPGVLRSLVVGAHDPVDWRQIPSPLDVGDMMQRLGIDELQLFSVVNQDRVVIGPQRQEVRHVCSSIVTALTANATTYPIAHFVDGVRPARVRMDASRGCHLGRHLALTKERALIGELVLDRAIQRGERAYSSFELTWEDPGGECTRWERGAHGRLVHAILTADFHPDALPAHVWVTHRPQGSTRPEDEVRIADIDLVGTRACFALDSPPSGILSLVWSWDDGRGR